MSIRTQILKCAHDEVKTKMNQNERKKIHVKIYVMYLEEIYFEKKKNFYEYFGR